MLFRSLYSAIIRKNKKAIAAVNPENKPVAPALLFIREAGKDGYDPILKVKDPNQENKRKATYSTVDDIETIYPDFIGRLKTLLADIFDKTKPFTPTEYKERCITCPYKNICG